MVPPRFHSLSFHTFIGANWTISYPTNTSQSPSLSLSVSLSHAHTHTKLVYGIVTNPGGGVTSALCDITKATANIKIPRRMFWFMPAGEQKKVKTKEVIWEFSNRTETESVRRLNWTHLEYTKMTIKKKTKKTHTRPQTHLHLTSVSNKHCRQIEAMHTVISPISPYARRLHARCLPDKCSRLTAVFLCDSLPPAGQRWPKSAGFPLTFPHTSTYKPGTLSSPLSQISAPRLNPDKLHFYCPLSATVKHYFTAQRHFAYEVELTGANFL